MNKLKISVVGLKKYFHLSKNNYVHAVDNISFDIYDGETLGLVGESGCGKTTTGRCILRLIEPDKGKIVFKGKNILELNFKDMLKIRKEMQIIFQDPFSSLDPRKNVEDLISEPLRIYKYGTKKQIRNRVVDLLDKVGLTKDMITKYPHELDGGRCQRIGIARALSLNPSFIICDEPVSALDVSAQAQIMQLLKQLNEDLDLTYLFIAHDLSVVRRLSDRIMVMYLGKGVELADSNELFLNPIHPYSQALISAVPSLYAEHEKERIILEGDVPTPINPTKGCRFSERCWESESICFARDPELIEIKPGHFVSCHKHKKVAFTKTQMSV